MDYNLLLMPHSAGPDCQDIWRDFIARCVYDVTMEEYVSGRDLGSVPRFIITKGESLYTIPGTPWVEIEADEKVISFLTTPFVPSDIEKG